MLTNQLRSKLNDLCRLLIDQHHAKVLIPPYASSSGYWFGGGNMTIGPEGDFYLVGRYRNEGDSRTGLAAGNRGLELAVFRSQDLGNSFKKVLSFSKQELSTARAPVLSIEGSAMRWTDDAVELYVSTEKDGVGYPSKYQNFLKPGTGVWSIDRLTANSMEGLKSATAKPVIASADPATIHVKDPFLYESQRSWMLLFCSHPFSWTCSNTGYARFTQASSGERGSEVFDFFPRGNVWDVAMSRGTCIVDVPKIGAFAGRDVQLMFYDGGECVREHEQHGKSVGRPRGHSCEELGGAAYCVDQTWQEFQRLSPHEPMFVSPFGSGSSRYVDILTRPEGMYATWQQSQDNGSQPLVIHFVPQSEIESVLA